MSHQNKIIMNEHDNNYMRPENKNPISCKECGEISNHEYCSLECSQSNENN